MCGFFSHNLLPRYIKDYIICRERSKILTDKKNGNFYSENGHKNYHVH